MKNRKFEYAAAMRSILDNNYDCVVITPKKETNIKEILAVLLMRHYGGSTIDYCLCEIFKFNKIETNLSSILIVNINHLPHFKDDISKIVDHYDIEHNYISVLKWPEKLIIPPEKVNKRPFYLEQFKTKNNMGKYAVSRACKDVEIQFNT
jgi:hypothetical protein